ncbi:MAG: hypothetical protein HY043_22330 [Verrucomicrobia bacterium]|nr:hypothetical protein [Verrucomicrobiota bacterium]
MKTLKPFFTSPRGICISRTLAASTLSLVIITSQTIPAAASDEKAQPPASKSAAKQETKTVREKDARVEITGSHIKQKIRRNGQFTTSAGSVLIVDRDAIERSGASNIPGVLAKTIGHR